MAKPAEIHKVGQRTAYIKALIYGDPGSGKTWLSATAPNPLLLLTEPAVSDITLRVLRAQHGIDPDIWEIGELEDLDSAYKYLLSAPTEYETVVLDSLTDLYRRIMRETIIDSTNLREHHKPDVPEQDDWFRVMERIRNLMRAFRDLPMHTVFTTLVLDIHTEMKQVPLVQPKTLAQELPSYCNLVGFLQASTDINNVVTRELLLESTPSLLAKNPGNLLSNVVTNPNLTTMFNIITNHKN